MLTKREALEAVSKALDPMNPRSIPLVVLDEQTIERPFGWVFFYQSKKFVETGEFGDRLLGNGPVIVNRLDGSIEFCPTYQRHEKSIEEYEKS
jgi:hypothetical protein